MIAVSLVDVIRSIVIGQSATMLAFVITNTILVLRTERPKPGRVLGILLASISIILAVATTVLGIISRLGTPPDWQIYAVVVMSVTGNFGFILLTMHSIFHSPGVYIKVINWIKHHDEVLK